MIGVIGVNRSDLFTRFRTPVLARIRIPTVPLKGFTNLYATDGKRMNSSDYGLHQIKAHRVLFLGQIISFELQKAVEELENKKREIEVNKKLSELTSNYGKRLYPVLEGSLKSSLSTMLAQNRQYVLGYPRYEIWDFEEIIKK